MIACCMIQIKNIGKICFLAFFLLLHGCEDNLSEDLRKNIVVAGDVILGQTLFFETYLLVDQAARDSVLWSDSLITIDKAKISLSQTGKSMWIDYGDSSVLCEDGFYRKGKIEAILPFAYHTDTLNITIRFADFYLNDRKIGGEVFISGNSVPFQNDYEVLFLVKDGRIQGSPRDILWTAEMSLNWYQGMDSPQDIADDKAYLTNGGVISGTSSNTAQFTARIISPLHVERTCNWITSGELDLEMPTLFVRFGSINFGEGACDGLANLKFNGNSIPYLLD